MKKFSQVTLNLFLMLLSSCACEPEQLAQYAFQGMEAMMGEGFMPSEEIRALGNFNEMNVSLQQSSGSGSTIILKLGNGDPLLLSNQREILARRCAEIYLREFEKGSEYDIILVQFVQTDPQNPENIAMEEYEFQVSDFELQDP